MMAAMELMDHERRGVYSAVAEIGRRHAGAAPDAPVPGTDCLTRFELKVFSQNGEDGVIAEILRRIGVRNRWFVEFGASDGRETNSAVLADVLGWSGVYIEADDQLAERLARRYAANPRVATVHGRVRAGELDATLDESGAPDPDVLSIDADGQDWWIFRSLRRRPALVIVEYNAALDSHKALVQPEDAGHQWDGTDWFGASLEAFELLARHKGYRLVHTDLTGVNAFFVRRDLDRGLPSPDSVPRRATNYMLGGSGHPPDPQGRGYLTVTDEMLG